VHAVFEENGMPDLFAARLKVVDRKITEIETIVVRSQAESMLFRPASLTTPSAGMTYMPQAIGADARAIRWCESRTLSSRAARRQFRHRDVPFAPDAYRFENGVRMAGPGMHVPAAKLREHADPAPADTALT
jgi:hypothetical protein